MLSVQREPWQADAACIDFGPDIFFSDDPDDIELARMVCAECLVRRECIDRWRARPVAFGVWGGFTPAELVALLRRQRAS